jgi:hypothetical protein
VRRIFSDAVLDQTLPAAELVPFVDAVEKWQARCEENYRR